MRKYLIRSVVLLFALSNAFYLAPTAKAQTWTMDRYNPSRTNQGSLIGPRNLPKFVTINNSINGSLIRSAPDGSIITWNPLIGSTGFGQIHRYLSNGSTSWDSSVPTDNFGLKDVAVDQNGTIYVISMGQVTALNKNTGNPTWTFQGGSDQSSPLAIGKKGTIYFHSGAAFFGSSETVTAIAPDGTSLWQAIGTFRGDSRMVFSTDESTVYLLGTKSLFGSPIGNVASYSTADGHKISDTPCDPRGTLFAYAPWEVLYSFAVDGAFFLGLSPDLSSCPLVSANGLSTVDIAATTRQGRILVQTLNSIAIIDQSSNNVLFNSNEPLVNGFVDSAGVLFAENPQTNEIVAIDTVSLTQLWRSSIKDPITGFSIGSDGNLYVSAGTALLKSAPVQQPVWPMAGHDPQRTGLSTFSGLKAPPSGPSWTFTSGGPIIGDLAVSVEGKIYFSSDKLYALNPDGTIYVPAVATAPITSPAIDDLNGFVYVIAVSDSRNYDVLRYSKQLQDPVVVYHGAFAFVNPTSVTVGPDGTIYFSDGVSLISVGTHSWRTQDRPCFGNPGFLAPTLGRDGSVYSMCNSGGGAGFGSGIYRYDGDTGIQITSAGYSRGGTELIIDAQNDIRAGFQAFDGGTFGGAYDIWDANLIKLTPGNNGDFTTSRSALFPDGLSTARIGFSFQTNLLEASGVQAWGVLTGPQTVPNFSTVPTIDAAGNVFVGTVSGVAALNGTDGHIIWFSPAPDTITTQPAISSDGMLLVGSAGGNIYAFSPKAPVATGTLTVSTNITAAFSVNGPVTFSGSGQSLTKTDVPVGTYTVRFDSVPGYITPPDQKLILTPGGTISFSGIYDPVSLSISQQSLSFLYRSGATVNLPSQDVMINGTLGAPISLSTTTQSGGNWLSISPTTGFIPMTAHVNVALGLHRGNYTGTIIVTSGGKQRLIAVNLLVRSTISYTVIFARTADSSPSPAHTPAYFATLIAQAREYHLDNSYGLVDVSIESVLNNNNSWYAVGPLSIYSGHERTFVTDAILAAGLTSTTIQTDGVIIVHSGPSSQKAEPKVACMAGRQYLCTETGPLDGSTTPISWVVVSEDDLVGPWAHEIGHDIGVLRTIWTTSQAATMLPHPSPSVGCWDLMTFGGWGQGTASCETLADNAGSTPSYMSSLSRATLGILQYSVLTKDEALGEHVINSLETSDQFQKIFNIALDATHCYVAEVRNNNNTISSWDTSVRDSGLVLYEIDTNGGPACGELTLDPVTGWSNENISVKPVLHAPGFLSNSTFKDYANGLVFKTVSDRLANLQYSMTFNISRLNNSNSKGLFGVVMKGGAAYKKVFAAFESIPPAALAQMPDLDLHAYTEDGRHIGINYATGEFENQLAADVSGNQFNGPEWIVLPSDVEGLHFFVSGFQALQFLQQFPALQSLVGQEDQVNIGGITVAPGMDEAVPQSTTQIVSVGGLTEIPVTKTVGPNGTVSLVLTSPKVTIDSLIAELRICVSVNAFKNLGVATALASKLEAAKRALSRSDLRAALGELRAFENQVSADNLIDVNAIRTQLLADAESFINTLK